MAIEDDNPVEVYRREVAKVLPLTKLEAARLIQVLLIDAMEGEEKTQVGDTI